MRRWSNEVTGANAGGRGPLPIPMPWAARIAQFCGIRHLHTYRIMSLFKSPKGGQPLSPEPDGYLPVTLFDLSKRYDLYCSTPSEDRLYEDVAIIGIRTFQRQNPSYRGRFDRRLYRD